MPCVGSGESNEIWPARHIRLAGSFKLSTLGRPNFIGIIMTALLSCLLYVILEAWARCDPSEFS